MKKTEKTKKLVLDRQSIRELTTKTLEVAGGAYPETMRCGGAVTYSCNHGCGCSDQLCV